TCMPAGWSTDADRDLVVDGHPGVQEHPTLHLDDRRALGRELLDQIAGRDLRLEGVPAREDVDGCISVLGPGVDGEMGLGDDDDAADAEGVELVEDDVDDGGLGSLRRLDQGFLHRLEAVDHVGVAIEQLDQQVPSQGVQSSGLPSSDPGVYGIPFEGRVNLRKGACGGPRDLRLASDSIETYSPALGRDLEDLPLADVGDCELPDGAPPREQLDAARAEIAAWWRPGLIPFM